MAMYLMCVNSDPATEQWLRKRYQAAGKKLDMGKSCLRFKRIEDVPLDVIGELIARTPVKEYIARIERILQRVPQKRKK